MERTTRRSSSDMFRPWFIATVLVASGLALSAVVRADPDTNGEDFSPAAFRRARITRTQTRFDSFSRRTNPTLLRERLPRWDWPNKRSSNGWNPNGTLRAPYRRMAIRGLSGTDWSCKTR